MLDLILRGGTVITPDGVKVLDVGISGSRIALLAMPGTLDVEATRIVDVAGKVLSPGGIEPHAHIGIPVEKEWTGPADVITQPPEAASKAAIFGGVTTILDFAGSFAERPDDPPAESISTHLEQRRLSFAEHSYADYSFHHILSGEVREEILAEIPEAVQEGIASFKIYDTDFPGRLPTGHLWAVCQRIAASGGILAVHAEDSEIVTFMKQKLRREGRDQAHNIHLVHNNLSEDLAFHRVIHVLRHTGAAAYFVHTSAKEGVAALAEARAAGLPVYGETLHNYLEFNCEHYRQPDGMAIHTYPSVKFEEDRAALEHGLLGGALSTVATDEYTTHKDTKLWGKTVENVCGGHNGIETRLPVTWAKFVATDRMSLQRFAEVTSTNAAKILGLYPSKGALAVGSDADIVVIDPTLRKSLELQDLHAASDYSIWEGFECEGLPVMTILRGKIVVEDGQLLGSPRDGQWLRRKVDRDLLAMPLS